MLHHQGMISKLHIAVFRPSVKDMCLSLTHEDSMCKHCKINAG